VSILEDLRKSVIDGDLNAAQDQAHKALAENIPPEKILTDGLISAMTEVGRMFENGDFFVPEMLIAARAMKAGWRSCAPSWPPQTSRQSAGSSSAPYRAICHDIGKNLVGMMLEGAGSRSSIWAWMFHRKNMSGR